MLKKWKKQEWIVQVYDDEGYACKMPRYFKGTERQVKKYIEQRFGLVDCVFDRTTRYYAITNEEDIPERIEL